MEQIQISEMPLAQQIAYVRGKIAGKRRYRSTETDESETEETPVIPAVVVAKKPRKRRAKVPSYKCDLCGHQFTRKDNVKRHMDDVHPNRSQQHQSNKTAKPQHLRQKHKVDSIKKAQKKVVTQP